MIDPCGAKKRDGAPCGAAPMKGGKRRKNHSGRPPAKAAVAAAPSVPPAR